MIRNVRVKAKTIRSDQQAGFTLVEVLLAMVITMFIATLAYNSLSASLNSAERHELKTKRLVDVQLALTIIERDIRHMVYRPIVDEYGNEVAALYGDVGDYYFLGLTRRGWDNPANSRRAGLQRVRYQLEGETLWREDWLLPDRISEELGQRKEKLLEGVEAIELNFLNPVADKAIANSLGGEWKKNWNSESNTLPLAIEITLQLQHLGTITRLISVS